MLPCRGLARTHGSRFVGEQSGARADRGAVKVDSRWTDGLESRSNRGPTPKQLAEDT
jgi:hypothetical protein